MKPSEKLSVLADLGIIDWLVEDEEGVRELVNAVADRFLDGANYHDFHPVDPTDGLISLHFEESGYDLNWFGLLSGEFVDSVHFEVQNIANSIRDSGFTFLVSQEMEQVIANWVSDWHSNCLSAFRRTLVNSSNSMS